MDNKNKWLPFAQPTTEELKALKKLIKVEPLLLSKSIVDDSEYRVYYNDEKNNLQYLYVGNDALEKQKELIQSLKNSPDFKEMVQEMVKGYVEASIGDLIKESISKENLVGFIGADEAANPEDTEVTTMDGKKKAIKNTSQYNYKFNCADGGSGSFACLLKKNSEYFILTAGHNLLKDNAIVKFEEKDNSEDPDKPKIYTLSKSKETIYLEYVSTGYPNEDYAILKIVKQNEANPPEWIPCTAEDVEDTDLYKNCIKGSDAEPQEDEEGNLVAKNQAAQIKMSDWVDFTEGRFEVTSTTVPPNDKLGEPGNSGGATVLSDYAKGIYLGVVNKTSYQALAISYLQSTKPFEDYNIV